MVRTCLASRKPAKGTVEHFGNIRNWNLHSSLRTPTRFHARAPFGNLFSLFNRYTVKFHFALQNNILPCIGLSKEGGGSILPASCDRPAARGAGNPPKVS
jgi:hypothetical protein